MNLDKRKKAYRKILREYQKFKRKLIYRSEKEVLWESCNKIHFYSSIRDTGGLSGFHYDRFKTDRNHVEIILKKGIFRVSDLAGDRRVAR